MLVTEYQEKLETFKPSYPAMVQINNKIKEIDRQLAAEVKAIKDSLKAAYEASMSQEEEMKKQIETLRSEVLDLQKRSIQYNILKREVDTNRSLYEGLLQRYKEVDVAGGVGANNIFIVDQAEMPSSPVLAATCRARCCWRLCLGLGAGLAAAYVLEQLDDTVRSPEELERITGLATLGIIPKVGVGAAAEAELADPRSALSEAYRSLCTALQFTTESGLPKTLVITSVGAVGRQVAHLAGDRAALRHDGPEGAAGRRRPAQPSLHKKLGCDNSIGLSNYLTGACTPPEALQATRHAQSCLHGVRPAAANAADLLGNARLHVAALGRARGLRPHRRRRSARDGPRRRGAAVERRGRHRVRRRRRAGAHRASCAAP